MVTRHCKRSTSETIIGHIRWQPTISIQARASPRESEKEGSRGEKLPAFDNDEPAFCSIFRQTPPAPIKKYRPRKGHQNCRGSFLPPLPGFVEGGDGVPADVALGVEGPIGGDEYHGAVRGEVDGEFEQKASNAARKAAALRRRSTSKMGRKLRSAPMVRRTTPL